MKTMTATEARRRFGALIKAVQHEPVLVVRRNGDKVVFMSAERYKRMTGTHGPRPRVAKAGAKDNKPRKVPLKLKADSRGASE